MALLRVVLCQLLRDLRREGRVGQCPFNREDGPLSVTFRQADFEKLAEAAPGDDDQGADRVVTIGVDGQCLVPDLQEPEADIPLCFEIGSGVLTLKYGRQECLPDLIRVLWHQTTIHDFDECNDLLFFKSDHTAHYSTRSSRSCGLFHGANDLLNSAPGQLCEGFRQRESGFLRLRAAFISLASLLRPRERCDRLLFECQRRVCARAGWRGASTFRLSEECAQNGSKPCFAPLWIFQNVINNFLAKYLAVQAIETQVGIGEIPFDLGPSNALRVGNLIVVQLPEQINGERLALLGLGAEFIKLLHAICDQAIGGVGGEVSGQWVGDDLGMALQARLFPGGAVNDEVIAIPVRRQDLAGITRTAGSGDPTGADDLGGSLCDVWLIRAEGEIRQ